MKRSDTVDLVTQRSKPAWHHYATVSTQGGEEIHWICVCGEPLNALYDFRTETDCPRCHRIWTMNKSIVFQHTERLRAEIWELYRLRKAREAAEAILAELQRKTAP